MVSCACGIPLTCRCGSVRRWLRSCVWLAWFVVLLTPRFLLGVYGLVGYLYRIAQVV